MLRYLKPFLYLLLVVVVSPKVVAQDAPESSWSFKGYIKNLQQWGFTGAENSLVSGGFFHNRLIARYTPDTVWTFDAEMRNRLFYGDWVRAQAGFADALNTDAGLADLSFVPVNRQSLVASVVLDRAWAQWRSRRWTVRLGRQRIHWGKALTWNPNDWFNSWNFLDFDYEERPGSDALRVQYQAGDFSQFDLALSPARSARNLTGALRYGGHTGAFDWQVLAGVFRNKLAAGLGWAGDVGKAGFKGEVSVFEPIDSSAGVRSVSATLELNLLLGKGMLLNGALLLNSNGLGSNTSLQQLTNTSLSADNLMPGKVSLLVSASQALSPLVQGSLSVLYSPNGQLLALVPAVAWSVAENWDLDLTGQCFWFQNDGQKPANAGNAIYLRTRWSF